MPARFRAVAPAEDSTFFSPRRPASSSTCAFSAPSPISSTCAPGHVGANQLRSIKNRFQPMRHTDRPNVRDDKFSLQREGTPDIGGTARGKQVRLDSILDNVNFACWNTPALDQLLAKCRRNHYNLGATFVQELRDQSDARYKRPVEFCAPTAHIDSGHRSRISSTNGTPKNRARNQPLNPTSNCGEVAITTSGRSRNNPATHADRRKDT